MWKCCSISDNTKKTADKCFFSLIFNFLLVINFWKICLLATLKFFIGSFTSSFCSLNSNLCYLIMFSYAAFFWIFSHTVFRHCMGKFFYVYNLRLSFVACCVLFFIMKLWVYQLDIQQCNISFFDIFLSNPYNLFCMFSYTLAVFDMMNFFCQHNTSISCGLYWLPML